MIRKLAALVLVVGLGVVIGTIATGAFSTAAPERTGVVTVATDENSLLELVDPTTGGLIKQESGGKLTIDFSRGGAAGATADTLFEFGSDANPTSDHAFQIHNAGSAARPVAVRYELAPGASDGEPGERNVEFAFYLDRGTDGSIESSVTVGEGEATETMADVGTDDTIYVVVTIDTRGLSSSSDLTGTLNVSGG